MPSIVALRSFLVAFGMLSACAPQTAPTSPATTETAPEPVPVAVVVPNEAAEPEPALAVVRIDDPSDIGSATGMPDTSVFSLSAGDPATGREDALVTLVVFGDLQCPFTQRLFATLQDLRQRYSDGDLRIVWKHLPLEFHQQAAPAAEAAAAVHQLGGARTFYCFLEDIFPNQRNLGTGVYQAAAQKCGVNPASMEAEVRAGNPTRKVEADKKLAQDTGSRGTPTSYINGIKLGGAQPIDKFIEVIDAEREEARRAVSSGVSPGNVHARRVAENFSKAAPLPTSAPKPVAVLPDTTIFHVPVGRSPTLGSPNALVTVVMFQDFQCPFCKRAAVTIDALRKEFGNDLRVVFKHNPLPFHKEAMPAAKLAMEARAQKGNAGFWQAHDALFAESRIDEAVLDQTAQSLRLNPHAARSAMTGNRHQAAIEADMDLAKQLGATGTPTFYINGRKLTGAQPIESFRGLVNEVMLAARALTQRGIPRSRVYAETIKNGSKGPNNP